jgi:hypothetical protein
MPRQKPHSCAKTNRSAEASLPWKNNNNNRGPGAGRELGVCLFRANRDAPSFDRSKTDTSKQTEARATDAFP